MAVLPDAPDLFVAADDRIEPSLAGLLGEVATVALQGLVGAFRILRGDALAAPNALQGAEHGIAAQPVALQELGHASRALFQQRQEQVLGRDIIVTQLARHLLGAIQALLELSREAHMGSATVDLGPAVQLSLHLLRQGSRLQAQALHHLGHHTLRLAKQGQEQVLPFDLSVAIFSRQALRLRDSLLTFWRRYCRPGTLDERVRSVRDLLDFFFAPGPPRSRYRQVRFDEMGSLLYNESAIVRTRPALSGAVNARGPERQR